METLKDLQLKAAEFNYFQFENLPAAARENEFLKTRIADHVELFNKLESQISPILKQNFVCGVFFKLQHDKNNDREHYYLENFIVLVLYKDVIIAERYLSYRNIYMYFPLNEYGGDSARHVYEWTKNIKAPNNIGGGNHTVKKLTNWFDYCAEYLTAIKSAQQNISTKRDESISIIENFINSFNCKEYKWSKNKNTCFVKGNIFNVYFEIYDNGNVSKTISHDYNFGLDEVAEIENVMFGYKKHKK